MPSGTADRKQAALAGSIYEAAADPAQWPEALARLAALCRARVAWLLDYDSLAQRSRTSVTHGLPGEVERLINDRYLTPSTNELLAVGVHAPAGCLFTMGAALPRPQLERTRIYREMVQPLDLEEMMVVNLVADRTGFVSCTLFRSRQEAAFGGRAQNVFLDALPHLERAARLQRRLQEAETRSRAFEAALERLASGVFLTGAEGRLLHANARGRALLAAREPLLLVRGRLVPRRPGDRARFHQALGAAARGGGAGGALWLPGPPAADGRQAGHALQAFPLAGALAGQGACLVLFVDALGEAPAPTEDRLRALWGLTPAEARLCQAIASGGGLAEAAAVLGVSLNTARTHLARVFDKTGTHRQAELVRLLLSVLGPASPPAPAEPYAGEPE